LFENFSCKNFYNCFFSKISAVKFGRMSKKQREKVEDEVRYHREINSQAQHSSSAAGGGGGAASGLNVAAGGSSTQPDSSVFDAPQPSSTEHVYGG
jgi:hypothetical protein